MFFGVTRYLLKRVALDVYVGTVSKCFFAVRIPGVFYFNQGHQGFFKSWKDGWVVQGNDPCTSWWLNQPIWKVCSSNWIISPSRFENRKYLSCHHLIAVFGRFLLGQNLPIFRARRLDQPLTFSDVFQATVRSVAFFHHPKPGRWRHCQSI